MKINGNPKKYISLSELGQKHFSKKKLEEIDKKVRAEILAENLKEIRIYMGLTQQELADKADLPRTTIARIETNTLNTTIGTLMRIARALGANLRIDFKLEKELEL